METAKNRLLALSYDIVPLALGIAFSFSDYTYIGVGIILAVSVWYGLLNWKAVLSDTWALTVIGFFLAIALKDGLLYALGSGSFKSFAKAGSRVVVLAGAAGLLNAYSKPEIEDIFKTALAILAGSITIITLFMRLKLIPYIFNWNTFGMSVLWFPLLLAYRLKKNSNRNTSIFSWIFLIVCLFAMVIDAIGLVEQGSRTAPFALLVGALFLNIPNFRTNIQKYFGYVLFAAASISIVFFSLTHNNAVNSLLFSRQDLWNAYLKKGMERIWTGWGWTSPADNIRLVAKYMQSSDFYKYFLQEGHGPHNSLLAMFFENGLIACVAYCVLIIARIAKSAHPFNFFDISFMAFIVFFSLDAFAPGGLSFLGYFLGICLLAVERKPGIASEHIGSQQMSKKL